MRHRIGLFVSVAIVSLLVTTPLFWWFEEATNPAVDEPMDALWWWVVTSATVGYGDIVPATTPGRLIGMVTIVSGIFIYTNIVASIAESAHAFIERRHRGTARISAQDHIVLCEYTSIADEFIQAFPSCPGLEDKEIVIVSDLVSRNPYPQHHFVAGVPINPAALRQANIEKAESVYVFANLRFADPDVKTIHVASRVIDLNPKARVYVEMVDPQNDLLKVAPDLIVMDSRELLETILRRERIDPRAWQPHSAKA
ncbi:MAG: ion transporter [Deltaproteobacteria bacterium]|jgi:voltage-gated potassium channel|nr:ion transporter [Deltaproteobacteria bacterium]MBW2529836.1 ion transporter [Deltaproteobacteria bacterium]